MMNNLKFDNKGIHLVHLNIRSLFCRNKFEMFKQQMIHSNIDIMCLSETWLKEGLTSNILDIPGYRLSRLDRNWMENNNIKKGGGLCMYINQKIEFTNSDISKLNYSSKDIEIQWMEIKFPKMRNIIIANIYRPPQGNVKNCCKYIRNCLNNMNDIDKNDVFFMGDFNINIYKKTSTESKELLNIMSTYGFKQFINETTRFGTKNTCIDLIFTNCDYINNMGTLDWNYSDHQAVFVTKKKQKYKNKKMKFYGRSYKNYNSENFQDDLKYLDWTELFKTEDPNEAWKFLFSKITEILEHTCPLKEFVVNEYREKWMNRDLMELIIDKDLAIRKAKKTKKNDDIIYAKRIRNETGKIIEKAKKDFLENEFINSKGDPKRFWKNIYSIIPKTSIDNQKDIIHLKNENNTNIDIKETSEFINDFFINIGPNLANKINEKWEYYDTEEINSIDNFKIDKGLVHLYVTEIDTTKSSGIDYISSRCLKEALIVLNAQISHIFELSVKSGIFPDLWKIATVVPLFKGGQKENVSNYRPVSLLPIPGKILEKLIHIQIMTFFTKHNSLCEHQSGFRPNHSTLNSIVNLTNDIFESVNNNKVTLAAFIDLKKAFDTVNHNILIKKLENMGIRGINLLWIKNYLDNRQQRTVCNNTLSKLDKIKCGVPQGSILGPLFFLVYINDIKNIMGEMKYQLYADDTVLYCNGNSYDECVTDLQNIINKFVSWCSKNALTINIKKTKVMTFGSKNKVKKAKNVVIKINNEILGHVPTYKYLGIHLDQTLNYKYHSENLLRLINHKLYMFSKIRRYLNVTSALAIYKTMILPYFDYGDIIYMSSNIPEIRKLDKNHIRGLRIGFKIQGKIEDNDLFNLANISNLENRRKVHLRNFMYRNKEKCVTKEENTITTRLNSGPTFKVKKPNCENYKRNVYYAGAVEWNSIDSDVRKLEHFYQFKRIQKSWLLKTYKD